MGKQRSDLASSETDTVESGRKPATELPWVLGCCLVLGSVYLALGPLSTGQVGT